MTQEEMNILVPEKLKEIESTKNVTILHACESGSRAWGFASSDSDFDVRFIYKRSLNEYLCLNDMRDVIEIPIDNTWDVSGWDLRKTLRLLYKSNLTLYEWLSSQLTKTPPKRGSYVLFTKAFKISFQSFTLCFSFFNL